MSIESFGDASQQKNVEMKRLRDRVSQIEAQLNPAPANFSMEDIQRLQAEKVSLSRQISALQERK